MAVAAALKDAQAVTTNTTPYTTASVSFVSGRRYLLFIMSGGSIPSSVTGGGTWTRLTNGTSTSAAVASHVYEMICTSSSTTTVSIAYGANDTGQGWVLLEITGDDTGASLVAGNTVTGAGTSLASTGLISPSPAATSLVIALEAFNTNEAQTVAGGTEMASTDLGFNTPTRRIVIGTRTGSDTITFSSATNDTRRITVVSVPIVVTVVNGTATPSVVAGTGSVPAPTAKGDGKTEGPIVVTTLVSGKDSTDTTTYGTGSFAPKADVFLVLSIAWNKSSGSGDPSVSSVAGLTWQKVTSDVTTEIFGAGIWVAKVPTGAPP